jgi:hypothetical protein
MSEKLKVLLNIYLGNEHTSAVPVRVARWHIFKSKIPIWVNFGGNCKGRYWYILWPFGLLTPICYILCPFGIFYGNLVYFSRFGMLHREKSGNPGPCRFVRRKLDGKHFFGGKRITADRDRDGVTIFVEWFPVCAGAARSGIEKRPKCSKSVEPNIRSSFGL